MAHPRSILDLTWREIADLPKERSAVFVVIAPVEEHSHHLPLGTDIFEGQHWLEGALTRLANRFPDYELLTLPSVPLAVGSSYGFPGCMHLRQATMQRVGRELLNRVAAWGIRNIVVIASHGDPRHQIAIEEACSQVNRKHGVCAFSPLGAFFSARELGIDLNLPAEVAQEMAASPNDFHAGWIETSMMLTLAPEKVREGWQQLPDCSVRETDMIFPRRIARAIAGFGHIGAPRRASAALGAVLNANVADYLAEAVASFFKRDGYERYQHHALYRMPFLRTGFLSKALWMAAVALTAAIAAWRWLR